MSLLGDLRAKDKKGIFHRTPTSISYSTGFHTLDYRNGFMLKALDSNNKLIREQPSVGIVGGSFNTVIGKSATAKTTASIQMAMNIVAPFDDGLVIHCDTEQATNYSRIRSVTGQMNKTLEDKYILKRDTVFIEDIFEFIISIADTKKADPKKYQYDTGLLDEFGLPIIAYVPTVILIDSIPSLALRDTINDTEMQGDTYATRKAKKLAQFYRHLGPIITSANIIVFTINHINDKIDINPFAKTQAQTMYLKMTESLPGGNSPIYYANNIFKFVSGSKFKREDDGFDGFAVKVELIKSRTNKAGQVATLIYDQENGFDQVRSLYQFAEEIKVVEGRNPKRFFTGHEEARFDSRKLRDMVLADEKLRYALYDTTIPRLEAMLSRGREDEVKYDEFEIMNRVLLSMHNEGLAG